MGRPTTHFRGKPTTRKPTVFQDIVSRGATPSEALAVMEFIVDYGRVLDAHGWESMRIDDYAAEVGLSRAQGFRRLALFREFFAGSADETPARFWSLARDRITAKSLPMAVAQLASLHPGYEGSG